MTERIDVEAELAAIERRRRRERWLSVLITAVLVAVVCLSVWLLGELTR